MRRVAAGEGEALVELELPPAYRDDLERYQFHPALADLATGVANAVWLHADGEGEPPRFLPLGYQQLTLSKALPATLLAHVRVNGPRSRDDDTISLEIALLDGHGAPLGEVNGFSVRRVADAAPARAGTSGESARVRTPATADSEGIAPSEGVSALFQVVAANAPAQVMVSKRDFRRAMQHYASDIARDASDRWNDRPDLGSEYAAPRNEVEEGLVDIWKELLGLNQVGVHDNFFDLGGDSLLATQIPAKLRARMKLGIELGTIFQAPTIAQISEHLQLRKWALEPPPATGGERGQREVGAL